MNRQEPPQFRDCVSPDSRRINVHEEHEVRYRTQALGISEHDLGVAVKEVGDSAELVRAHIKVKQSESSEPTWQQMDDESRRGEISSRVDQQPGGGPGHPAFEQTRVIARRCGIAARAQ